MEHTLRLPSPSRSARQAPADDLVRLAAHATLARELPAGACIAVQSGRVWITQTGDADDYVVGAGERLVLARAGRVVVESFRGQATLRLSRCMPGARAGFP